MPVKQPGKLVWQNGLLQSSKSAGCASDSVADNVGDVGDGDGSGDGGAKIKKIPETIEENPKQKNKNRYFSTVH